MLSLLAYMAVGHNVVQLWSLLALSFFTGILLLNLRFYLFFARIKHPLFVLLVIPLHILYYLYSSLAFVAAVALYLGFKVARREPAARTR